MIVRQVSVRQSEDEFVKRECDILLIEKDPLLDKDRIQFTIAFYHFKASASVKIHDAGPMDGERLCSDCADRYYHGVENGEPPRPNARCHMAKYLTHLLPPLRADAAAARHIAAFLEHPFPAGQRHPADTSPLHPADTRAFTSLVDPGPRPLLRRIVAVDQTTAPQTGRGSSQTHEDHMAGRGHRFRGPLACN